MGQYGGRCRPLLSIKDILEVIRKEVSIWRDDGVISELMNSEVEMKTEKASSYQVRLV